MRIAVHDADKTGFPNLALMKLSAWHKSRGDEVVWYDALWSHTYDRVYSSKVFTFKPNKKLQGNIIYGGTGYGNVRQQRRDMVDILENHMAVTRCPDYSLYSCDYSLGFLTRGCPNKCPWCIVPHKEGNIRPESDIEDFLRHDNAILMDNNVLACDHGIHQIEKIVRLGIKVDFNQGLDARLIDDTIARLLAKVKWLHQIRLACDTQSQMKHIHKAVTSLRWYNAKPSRFSVYMIVHKDIDEAMERAKFLKGLHLDPFAQPYIDFKGKEKPSKEQRRFARWVNFGRIFNSVLWENYN